MNKELIDDAAREPLVDYFNGDTLAADVWTSKYMVKDKDGKSLEKTPDEMHQRLAKEFARIENGYREQEFKAANNDLSKFGKKLLSKRALQDPEQTEQEVFEYFQDFKWIIPQGSIMSILGHPHKVGSLSNCFVIPSPHDSYGGIMRADEQLVQLMKRRGGVGTNLNSLRPSGTVVHNSAGTSTGSASFMDRFSNSTREVAQDGRRGALMLLLSCKHPDIFKFVTAKKDRTRVTGANVSVMLTNDFLLAAEKNEDFLCSFPINFPKDILPSPASLEYNKLTDIEYNKWGAQVMKIKARELFDLIIDMAWENAEPGIAFMDRVIEFSPDGVYDLFKAIASNPCGEQWLPAYDSCRLFALNLFSIVRNPFTEDAVVDWDKLYEISYMQQRFADNLIDLELERISAILEKIDNDPEPIEVKRAERELWENVYNITKAGRRTGCGFTGLGDMLAALELIYDSPGAMDAIEEVCKVKMRAELDATIDMAILRGHFEGWDNKKEYPNEAGVWEDKGANDFYTMLLEEFPEQVFRMMKYGRRNVSWSTVAPTGSLSILAKAIKSPNISSGMEPQFMLWYMRRRKINPSDKNMRVDFVDQNGDSWQEYPVVMGAFRDWYEVSGMAEERNKHIEDLTKDEMAYVYEQSPWYGSTANDIDWTKRVEIQALIQRYTTNAISSTINLPSTVKPGEVAQIYWAAWKHGLKGVTVYREGCRTGVLVNTDNLSKQESFAYRDAVKRPKTLDCNIHVVKVKGVPYTVVVGLYDGNPYEVFVIPYFEAEVKKGFVTKKGKGKYDILTEGGEVIDANITAEVTDEEGAITRLTSTSLRHGADVKFIVEQLNKSKGDIVSFTKAMARVLKTYIPEGTKSTLTCSECGSSNVVFKEGCNQCQDCGHSKCG